MQTVTNETASWVGKAFADWGVAVALIFVAVVMVIVMLFCFVWAVRGSSRFFAPKITTFFEGHAGLVETLKENNVKQTEFADRQTEMASAIVGTLHEHGRILDTHSQHLHVIAEKVGARLLPAPGSRSTTLVPGIEVDRKGDVRPVMLTDAPLEQK